MSVDATRSTWKLQNISSSEKLLLLSLADRANDHGECYPSIKRLSLDTGLERKTIMSVRQKLIEKGLMVFTGETKGRTGLVKVVRLTYVENRHDDTELNSPNNGTVQNLNSPKNGTCNSPKNGTFKQSQKRDLEPNNIKPIKEPNKTTVENPSVVVDVNFNNKTKEQILALKSGEQYLDDKRSNEQFLDECMHHVKSLMKTGKAETERHATNQLLKLIRSGRFRTPDGFKPKQTPQQQESRYEAVPNRPNQEIEKKGYSNSAAALLSMESLKKMVGTNTEEGVYAS